MESVVLKPEAGPSLSDARLQLHHAVQLATAAGISYLPAKPDDSHTNLEWLTSSGMLASNVVPAATPFRVAVRVADLTLAVLSGNNTPLAEVPLNGRTIDQAATWVKARLAQIGVDPARYTLKRHYEIPGHRVATGAPFDWSNSPAFMQIAAWFATASRALEDVRQANENVSETRCWPHHFDIAVLIEVGPARTVGVGMEPGDVYYDEPYFYVNAYPQPEAPNVPLAGHGTWHTHEWIGAVLPISRLAPSTARDDVRAFLRSAVEALKPASRLV